MEIGDQYMVASEFAPILGERQKQRQKLLGTVIYIHPALRFVVLEFQGICGKFREAFAPTQLPRKNRR